MAILDIILNLRIIQAICQGERLKTTEILSRLQNNRLGRSVKHCEAMVLGRCLLQTTYGFRFKMF